MTDFFLNAFAVLLLMNIWFNTNAVVEYFLYFNIGHWIDANGYIDHITEKRHISFPTYLIIKYPESFLVKILACPICACTWLNIFFFLIDLDLVKFVYCYSLSLYLFFLLQLIIKGEE